MRTHTHTHTHVCMLETFGSISSIYCCRFSVAIKCSCYCWLRLFISVRAIVEFVFARGILIEMLTPCAIHKHTDTQSNISVISLDDDDDNNDDHWLEMLENILVHINQKNPPSQPASQSVGKPLALSASYSSRTLFIQWWNHCGIYLYFRSFILRQCIKNIESFGVDLLCSLALALKFRYRIHDRNHTITTQTIYAYVYNSLGCFTPWHKKIISRSLARSLRRWHFRLMLLVSHFYDFVYTNYK